LHIAGRDSRIAAAYIIDFSTITGTVTPQDGVINQRTASVVIHPTTNICRITTQGEVRQYRAALVVYQPATKIDCRITAEDEIRQHRVALDIVHPTTGNCRVTPEGEVCQCQAALVIVHPAAAIIRRSAIGIAPADGEAIQHGTAIQPAAGHHVIDIVAVIIQITNFSAQDGDVRYPIALLPARFRAGKAAVNLHAVLQRKGSIARGARVVQPRFDPNFMSIGRVCKRGLQCTGIAP